MSEYTIPSYAPQSEDEWQEPPAGRVKRMLQQCPANCHVRLRMLKGELASVISSGAKMPNTCHRISI
jgi:hypothetical protein